MPRLVKCQDTGELIDKSTAYRAENGKYWSDLASYKQHEFQKEWRKKCIETLFELLGFKQGQTAPTNLYSQLKKFEGMGYDVVFDTIVDQKDQILWAVHNKEFKQTSGMIMYVSRIIENHVMDIYKKKQADKKREELQDSRHFEDTEDDDLENIGTSGSGRDVSGLLGDDLWN